MIWGYDYSAQLIANAILLVVVLSVIILRQYAKKRRSNNGENKSCPATDDE